MQKIQVIMNEDKTHQVSVSADSLHDLMMMMSTLIEKIRNEMGEEVAVHFIKGETIRLCMDRDGIEMTKENVNEYANKYLKGELVL